MTGAEKIAAVLGGAHRSGDWWRCRCPVHGSRGATLALRDGDRGLIVKCFADCDPRDILAELRRRRLITGRGDDAGPAPPIIRRDNHADVRRRHASPARVVVDEDHDLAHAWHAIPNGTTRRLLLPAKNNVGDDRIGYAYRIEPASCPGAIQTCRIAWELDPVTVTADEALAPRDAKAKPRPRDMAAGWLRDLLANHPVSVREIEDEAKAAGFSVSTVRRAADELGITTEKTGYEGGWAWRLPDQAGEEIEL